MTENYEVEYSNYAWTSVASVISKQEEARIKETIAMIPKDCSSILDLGCGDGRVTNRLINNFSYICGLDSSEEALKHVKTEKKLGRVDSLPFSDQSFDLILCSELLEHLTFPVYPKALKEIERVARKYILITVPNRQNRKLSSITCPYCGCIFDTYRHLRSFSPEIMKNLFDQFQPRIIKPYIYEKTYPNFVGKTTKLFSSILKNSFPSTALCPQCGYFSNSNNQLTEINLSENTNQDKQTVNLREQKRNHNPIINIARVMIKVIPKKTEGIWLGALYVRR